MGWLSESTLNWSHLLFLRLLKCGSIPRHIAFIMDGNRRFAKKNQVRKLVGHYRGFDKLSETLQWCLDLGVKEVTVYAFSIENFKRSKEEVDDLLELTREKFKNLLAEKEKLMERGFKIRVIGNTSLLPPDIVKLIAEAELTTMKNAEAILNVAFSYTAQDEMTNSVDHLVKGLRKDLLNDDDLNIGLFNECLYTHSSPPPELIIRTSGETRLSDFLLYQGSSSFLHFTGVLWPELSAWDFLWAIFKYQVHSPELRIARENLTSKHYINSSGLTFVDNVKETHVNMLQQALQFQQ